MDFDKNLLCHEAVLIIYFSDFEKNIEIPKLIKDVIQLELENKINYEIKSLPDPKKELALRTLEVTRKIKSAMPNITPICRLHSLVWINWALNISSILPTNLFFEKFLFWRLKLPRNQLYLMQYRKSEADKKWHGPTANDCEFGKVHGYSIDSIIAGETIRDDIFSLIWQMKPYARVVAQQEKIKKAKLKVGENGRESRKITEICGTQLFNTLTNCVTKAAKSGRINALSKRKKEIQNGQYLYVCRISRDELIICLKKRCPQVAEYSDETIKRALPSIVKCPRGKSKRPT